MFGQHKEVVRLHDITIPTYCLYLFRDVTKERSALFITNDTMTHVNGLSGSSRLRGTGENQ